MDKLSFNLPSVKQSSIDCLPNKLGQIGNGSIVKKHLGEHSALIKKSLPYFSKQTTGERPQELLEPLTIKRTKIPPSRNYETRDIDAITKQLGAQQIGKLKPLKVNNGNMTSLKPICGPYALPNGYVNRSMPLKQSPSNAKSAEQCFSGYSKQPKKNKKNPLVVLDHIPRNSPLPVKNLDRELHIKIVRQTIRQNILKKLDEKNNAYYRSAKVLTKVKNEQSPTPRPPTASSIISNIQLPLETEFRL